MAGAAGSPCIFRSMIDILFEPKHPPETWYPRAYGIIDTIHDKQLGSRPINSFAF